MNSVTISTEPIEHLRQRQAGEDTTRDRISGHGNVIQQNLWYPGKILKALFGWKSTYEGKSLAMFNMNPFHQMLIIVLSGLVGFLIIIGIMTMFKPSSQTITSSLPAEVIEHSKKYVEALGTKPFDGLKTNQKLILIQSYYNLENYTMVIKHAETMIDELRQLIPERKLAFTDIIENAYRHLGQENVGVEFREAVGL